MRTSILLVALGCAAATIGGCGGSSDESGGTPASRAPEGELVDGATFTYGAPADPGALDPATNYASAGSRLFAFTYDRLVGTDAKNEIVPNLATKWEVGPKRVKFTLREGVTCSDGSPVTASVIAKSLNHLKSPDVQRPALGTLDYQVQADDEAGTVTVRFGQPVAFPLYRASDIPIVCGEGLDNRKMLARETSGSGPYVLTEAVPNDHYTLTLRKGYTWGPDGASTAERGMPATVTLRIVPNETTMANLLLSGDLQTGEVVGAEVERLEQRGMATVPGTEVIRMAFFNESADLPTADPAVRKALMMATNRDEAAQVARGKTASTLLPPTMDPCTDPAAAEAIPGFDPAAAASLLDEAGWAKGSDGVRAKDGRRLELTVLAQTSVGAALQAANELIVKGWRELGAAVRVKTGSDSALQEWMFQGAWDAIPLLAFGVPDPSGLMPIYSGPAPPKGTNLGHVDNARFQELTQQALAAAGTDEACGLWNQAQAALYAEADTAPIIEIPFNYFRTDDVSFEADRTAPIPTSIRMYEG